MDESQNLQMCCKSELYECVLMTDQEIQTIENKENIEVKEKKLGCV